MGLKRHWPSVCHAAHADRIHHSDGICLCKGGWLILMFLELISDFNPVWGAHVLVCFLITSEIISVPNMHWAYIQPSLWLLLRSYFCSYQTEVISVAASADLSFLEDENKKVFCKVFFFCRSLLYLVWMNSPGYLEIAYVWNTGRRFFFNVQTHERYILKS